MTFEDALRIVEKQNEMLAEIKRRDLEAQKRLRTRIEAKIDRGDPLDMMGKAFAQEQGLA